MELAVEVKSLVKRYKELVALDHFNLAIKEGEIFGLLGPNGQSEGMVRLSRGSVTVTDEARLRQLRG